MEYSADTLDYDVLINKNLLGVIKDALKYVSTRGLPGENHFYITFKTNIAGVKIPDMLKIQYPENMTIVLQHQFSALKVDDEKFSVVLVFGGVPHTLVVPFDAITYFADPAAKFGLSFESANSASRLEDADIKENSVSHNAQPAEVISIDSFRKKK